MEAETPGEASPTIRGEKVRDRMSSIQEVLEGLLSKKNLVRDQTLASSMNPQMYISINILLMHEKLQALNASHEEVAAAAVRSKRLGIDDKQTMVRPVLKSKRNVVILREIPEGTTQEDIMQLLQQGPHAEHIVSAKPEVNNTWFVKFNLDDGTQDVVLWLRSQRLKDQPVNAAIKSEHFLRSFYPSTGPGPGPQMHYNPAPADFNFPPSGLQMQFSMPQMVNATGYNPMANEFRPAQSSHFMRMNEAPVSLQGPGFWKPWGVRAQQPALVFSSATHLVPQPGMPVIADQAAQFGDHVVDNFMSTQSFTRSKGSKDGKYGIFKGGKDSSKGGTDVKGGKDSKVGKDSFKGYDGKGKAKGKLGKQAANSWQLPVPSFQPVVADSQNEPQPWQVIGGKPRAPETSGAKAWGPKGTYAAEDLRKEGKGEADAVPKMKWAVKKERQEELQVTFSAVAPIETYGQEYRL